MANHTGSLMTGAPQWYDHVTVGDFDSNSSMTQIGSTNDYYGYGASGLSDGTSHYHCGGWHNHKVDLGYGLGAFQDHILQFAYDETSTTQVDFGTLSALKSYSGTTCDHNNGYLVGAFYYGGQQNPHVTSTEIEKFSCSSGSSEVKANLSLSGGGNTTCGNGDKLVVKTIVDGSWTTHNDEFEYQFSSEALNNSYGTFSLDKARGVTSAGEEIAGVSVDSSNTQKFFKDAWESGSTAVNYGSALGQEDTLAAGG